MGFAIQKNKNHPGYLSEYHAFEQTKKAVGDYAEMLAAEILATSLGIKVYSSKTWNEQKEFFLRSSS